MPSSSNQQTLSSSTKHRQLSKQTTNGNTTTTTTKSTKPKPKPKSKLKSKQTKASSGKGTTETRSLAPENDDQVAAREEHGRDEERLVAVQQRLLWCFRDAFYSNDRCKNNSKRSDGGGSDGNDVSDSDGGDDCDGSNSHGAITDNVQRVKQHLYHREFDAAFGEPGLREAYALRWSAGRAIGYLRVLEEVLSGRIRSRYRLHSDGEERGGCGEMVKRDLSRVVCLGGGGGAELVALVRWFARGTFREGVKRDEGGEGTAVAAVAQPSENIKLAMSIVDVADWSSVINKLHTAVTSSIPISAYTSASARAAAIAQAGPLIRSSDIEVQFRQLDLLSDLDAIDGMATMIKSEVQEAWLLTIMFTMSELCHASFGKAYRLLSWLTANVPSGCILLIVDSPGSYSSIGLKDGERKYPMRFYLDYALLGRRGSSGGDDDKASGPAAWKRLVGEESRWLRHSQRLDYPIQLEDMRVQIHLFEKI